MSDKFDKQDGETYEQHARRIASAVGLNVEIKVGAPRCPAWGKARNGLTGTHCHYARCDGYHGKHWRVGLVTRSGESYVFSFWSSVHDDGNVFHRPTVYDVLSCLSWGGPTTPDDVVEEYGEMKPSQAIACAEHNRALRDLVSSGLTRDLLSRIA